MAPQRASCRRPAKRHSRLRLHNALLLGHTPAGRRASRADVDTLLLQQVVCRVRTAPQRCNGLVDVKDAARQSLDWRVVLRPARIGGFGDSWLACPMGAGPHVAHARAKASPDELRDPPSAWQKRCHASEETSGSPQILLSASTSTDSRRRGWRLLEGQPPAEKERGSRPRRVLQTTGDARELVERSTKGFGPR
jgi:hypothetical protein